MKRNAVLLVTAMLAAVTAAGNPLPATAKDLGVRGATWPVAEPDLLEAIEARLLEMERSGKLARLEREARERARARLEEPDPVPGSVTATEKRSRLLDPSVTVAREIRTPEGTLLAAAGTRVNPLERMTLSRDLVFVDGRRGAEIAWVLAREAEGGRPARIVLVAGRPLELMRRHRRPFFFDQGGRLAARFGIVATPSLVVQAGALLRITEIPVEDRDRPGTEARPAASDGGTGSRAPVSATETNLQQED